MDGVWLWVDGEMDGWIDVKSVLRIACKNERRNENQKKERNLKGGRNKSSVAYLTEERERKRDRDRGEDEM